MDNVFFTRLRRVNRTRTAVMNGNLSMREILDEAERVLKDEMARLIRGR